MDDKKALLVLLDANCYNCSYSLEFDGFCDNALAPYTGKLITEDFYCNLWSKRK